MATSQARLALWKARREQGLCIHCGAPAVSRQTRCQKCVERGKRSQKKSAERRASQGLCRMSGCSNQVKHPQRTCESCKAKNASQDRTTRRKWIEAGMCAHCGKLPPWNGKTRCEACHKELLASVQRLCDRRAAEGLCRTCAEPVAEPGYKKCQACIDVGSQRHARLKIRVMDAYGGAVCVGCGEPEMAVLQIDHIDGGGHEHAKEIGGRGKMYAWLRDNNFPPGFRVLCSNCNIRAARGLPFPSGQSSRRSRDDISPF
jgi:hypothetical protein